MKILALLHSKIMKFRDTNYQTDRQTHSLRRSYPKTRESKLPAYKQTTLSPWASSPEVSVRLWKVIRSLAWIFNKFETNFLNYHRSGNIWAGQLIVMKESALWIIYPKKIQRQLVEYFILRGSDNWNFPPAIRFVFRSSVPSPTGQRKKTNSTFYSF